MTTTTETASARSADIPVAGLSQVLPGTVTVKQVRAGNFGSRRRTEKPWRDARVFVKARPNLTAQQVQALIGALAQAKLLAETWTMERCEAPPCDHDFTHGMACSKCGVSVF